MRQRYQVLAEVLRVREGATVSFRNGNDRTCFRRDILPRGPFPLIQSSQTLGLQDLIPLQGLSVSSSRATQV